MNNLNKISTAYDLGGKRARLLVVDDQPSNIRLIHQIFSDSHDVFMARSGQQALDFCVATIPDLILLDVEMPEMSGLEVCQKIKQSELSKDIPIIFVTGRQSPEDEVECWEAGCVDFVSKPVNALTLRNRVNAHLKLKFQNDQLREIAFVDGLTNIANRRFFDERLSIEFRRCQRNKQALSVLMVDVDYFKRYNDLYGHQQGDDCLRKIAATLKAQLWRPDDLVARYGGEEFVCLLPETDLDGVTVLATRLESAVRNLALAHGNSDVAEVVTISLGGASVIPTTPEGELLLVREADKHLYQAKLSGRGRFVIASD